MDIDYDKLVEKLKESLENNTPKKLTGRAYWAHLRREKNKLEENYIAPESGALLLTQKELDELVAKGLNWSIKEREAIRIALAGVSRHTKGK